MTVSKLSCCLGGMGVAADMMTRPLFIAIMVTSWMCIQGRDDCLSSEIAVNCSYIPDGKSVTCTVDYSGVEEPEKCRVNASLSYLNDIHGELMMDCSNGTGREGLSFDVRNVQEGQCDVLVRTTCGEACTSVNVTLQDQALSPQGFHGPIPLRTHSSCVIVGLSAVIVVVFIMLAILKPKRLCSRLLKLPARDTDVESNCSSSHEEPVILLDTNTDEASS